MHEIVSFCFPKSSAGWINFVMKTEFIKFTLMEISISSWDIMADWRNPRDPKELCSMKLTELFRPAST